MYEKPKLERFGTFRDLTRSGSNKTADAAGTFCGPELRRT